MKCHPLTADGDVIDTSLHTITVQKFFIKPLPLSQLKVNCVTDTFKNWRGMSQAGVRRIKMLYFNIDQSSVHLMSEAIAK